MRLLILDPRTRPPEHPPPAAAGFAAPVPYDPQRITARTHRAHSRCTYCLAPPLSMKHLQPGTGTSRWLTLCDQHDRHHRWLQSPDDRTWWYLARNSPPGNGHWWHLYPHPRHPPSRQPRWHLLEAHTTRALELGPLHPYQARAATEHILTAGGTL
ncbi:hypothetical protein CU254_00445 [Amycolatopsis sp. AA4]|uniref:hypothetical protein n=1 Tax=Actinomycetes TaxID=1760 RepID=UPI0001B55A19|nr:MULTISPECIES: hypothetical protein [Actinomycetes]ATY09121.1 hypothetical protein CU254_00445 [Amycolatopsis sp. AA4]EFL04416.1 predicted protein [Streptomyces sp. AA4]